MRHGAKREKSGRVTQARQATGQKRAAKGEREPRRRSPQSPNTGRSLGRASTSLCYARKGRTLCPRASESSAARWRAAQGRRSPLKGSLVRSNGKRSRGAVNQEERQKQTGSEVRAARVKPAKRHRCGKGRSRVSLAGQARSAWAGARGLKICESGMRIIGGKFKGRVLKRPGTAAIRPTSDRLRETVFNILAHAYGRPFAGARIIDLYAGTGAMGVEALSRGARLPSSSTVAPGRAPSFAQMQRLLALAAHSAFSSAMRASSARRVKTSGSISLFSIRLTAGILSGQLSLRCAMAAGFMRARS